MNCFCLLTFTWYVLSDSFSCPGAARLPENRFAALNRDLIIYRKTAKFTVHSSKNQKVNWKNETQLSVSDELRGVRNLAQRCIKYLIYPLEYAIEIKTKQKIQNKIVNILLTSDIQMGHGHVFLRLNLKSKAPLRSHFPWEICKYSFICKVKSTVYTNPSRKRSFRIETPLQTRETDFKTPAMPAFQYELSKAMML